jgi:hypothetical protein
VGGWIRGEEGLKVIDERAFDIFPWMVVFL